jgi:hypothetical protein
VQPYAYAGKLSWPCYHVEPPRLGSLSRSARTQMHHTAFLMEFGLKHLRADPNKHLQVMVYDLDGANIWHLDTRVSRPDMYSLPLPCPTRVSPCFHYSSCQSAYGTFYTESFRGTLLSTDPPMHPRLCRPVPAELRRTRTRTSC